MTGKWHVTSMTTPQTEADKHNWPRQRGFDRFYGTIHGAGSFFDPNTLVRDNAFISPFADAEYQPREFYYTDAINDQAARFITGITSTSPIHPSFSTHGAHGSPLASTQRPTSPNTRAATMRVIDAIRTARLEKMKARPPGSAVAGHASGRRLEHNQATTQVALHGSLRRHARLHGSGHWPGDRHVEEERSVRPLILFLQDNGGCAEGMGPFKPRVHKYVQLVFQLQEVY